LETANPSNPAIVCLLSIEIAVMRQPARLLCAELLQVESEPARTLFRIDTYQIDDIQAPQLIANISIQHPVDPKPT
jgi:hypothetical protein